MHPENSSKKAVDHSLYIAKVATVCLNTMTPNLLCKCHSFTRFPVDFSPSPYIPAPTSSGIQFFKRVFLTRERIKRRKKERKKSHRAVYPFCEMIVAKLFPKG